MMNFVVLGCVLFFSKSIVVGGYRPVVILHGLLDSPHGLDDLKNYIQQKHPGTNVTLLDVLHGWKSLAPLWSQVNDYKKYLKLIMNESIDGINLIGYSQGGVVGRGLIESTNNHDIKTFISLSAPMMGQYGNAGFLHNYFPTLVKEYAYKFFYTLEGQLVSIGNFWNDPHHQDLFRNMSAFLPLVNNVIDHPNKEQSKANFKRLKRLVLVGGPDDGIVAPWQSSHFGFYDENEEVVLMKKQQVYLDDSFGLRSLDQSGRLMLFTMKGIDHFSWHKNRTVFDRAVLPFLD